VAGRVGGGKDDARRQPDELLALLDGVVEIQVLAKKTGNGQDIIRRGLSMWRCGGRMRMRKSVERTTSLEGNGPFHLWTIFQAGKMAVEDVTGIVF
jgi:hypothetical protein